MKKTWAVGLFAIFLAVSVVSLTVNLQKRIVLNEAEINLNNLATSVEMDLDRALFGLDQVFLGLENYLEVASVNGIADDPAVRSVLDKILAENRLLVGLAILDGHGNVQHWNNNHQKPDLSHRDYFKVHTSGDETDFYIGNPQQSIINKGQWIFGISRAFRGENGELVRVAAAIINVNQLYRRYETLFSRAKAELTVFSEQGNIYTRIPGHREFAGQFDPNFQKKIDLAINDPKVHYHLSPDGVSHLAVIHKLGSYPIYVSVVKDDALIYAEWRANNWIYIALGGTICLVILLLTVWTTLSQRRQLETNRILQAQAITDPLTELFNRRHILKQGELEIKKSHRMTSPLSFIMLDLDHFKLVNDNCGYATGDMVLEEVACLLTQSCRDTDLISRFGGEEFLLLLPGTDSEGAWHIAEKIRTSIEEHVFGGPKGEFHVTGSLGVCQFNGEEDLSTVLQRTDAALYNAKEAGRNQSQKASSRKGPESRQDKFFWLNKRQH